MTASPPRRSRIYTRAELNTGSFLDAVLATKAVFDEVCKRNKIKPALLRQSSSMPGQPASASGRMRLRKSRLDEITHHSSTNPLSIAAAVADALIALVQPSSKKKAGQPVLAVQASSEVNEDAPPFVFAGESSPKPEAPSAVDEVSARVEVSAHVTSKTQSAGAIPVAAFDI